MTKPMLLADFPRLPRPVAGRIVDGLAAVIDTVADAGPPSHRFLRHQWFAAALRAYGGQARTLIVSAADVPALAMPLVPFGLRGLGLASVPGSWWPFRSFPASAIADGPVFEEALRIAARHLRGLRVGPVYDGDPSLGALVQSARAHGWAVLSRRLADSFVFDLAAARAEGWPRNSTLRKNRFHEKHLAAHGALDWRFLDGGDFPAAFDPLATIEERSWIAERTDGSDAKFTGEGHGAFWRAAAEDPVLAGMFHAALLTVDGVPAAFSFDLDAGDLRYAIANSYVPDFARHSPGKLLYYRNLVDAAARGIAKVDWGAGDSGYKQTIGATQGPAIRDWLLLRPGVPAALGRAFGAMWRGPAAAGQG